MRQVLEITEYAKAKKRLIKEKKGISNSAFKEIEVNLYKQF